MKKIVALLISLSFLLATPIFAASVPTMDKNELKSLLGTEHMIILDVRTDRDWDSSELKIKGSVRMDGFDYSLVKQYPKDTTFVLYCA